MGQVAVDKRGVPLWRKRAFHQVRRDFPGLGSGVVIGAIVIAGAGAVLTDRYPKWPAVLVWAAALGLGLALAALAASIRAPYLQRDDGRREFDRVAGELDSLIRKVADDEANLDGIVSARVEEAVATEVAALPPIPTVDDLAAAGREAIRRREQEQAESERARQDAVARAEEEAKRRAIEERRQQRERLAAERRDEGPGIIAALEAGLEAARALQSYPGGPLGRDSEAVEQPLRDTFQWLHSHAGRHAAVGMTEQRPGFTYLGAATRQQWDPTQFHLAKNPDLPEAYAACVEYVRSVLRDAG